MDDKKKIVLSSKDVFPKKIEDIFINVNLQKSFDIIKKERLDYNFDLFEKFRSQRNKSRNFIVYGIIDSTIIDCDNLTIKVWSNSVINNGNQVLSGLLQTITSQQIGFGDKNVFGKMRGKYIVVLDNYQDSDTIYLEVEGNNSTYGRTVIEQRLVFKDSNNDFVEYGTETVDIGLNGEIINIENNFPFFYNKHWVKSNFQIEKVKFRNVSFSKSSYIVSEGDSKVIKIELSEPSVFGHEKITVSLDTPIFETYNHAAPDLDFIVNSPNINFPIDLTWDIGEQFKEIDITALQDFIIEKSIETLSISLILPENVTINQGILNINTSTISIIDLTPKKGVVYNFQKIIKNITPLIEAEDFYVNLGVIPGYEMNIFGAAEPSNQDGEFSANYRFFPNDDFKLTIINEGDNTTLPNIPELANTNLFLGSNDSVTLDIKNDYQDFNSLPKEVAVLNFVSKDASGSVPGIFYINGVTFGTTFLAADNFVLEINNFYSNSNLPIPFDIFQQGKVVTLTAKHPATNINVYIPKVELNIENNYLTFYALENSSEHPNYPLGRTSNITEQKSFKLNLYANLNQSTSCRYSFIIEKPGYKTIFINSDTFESSLDFNEVFLVTPIKNVVGPLINPPSLNYCDYNNYYFDSEGYYLNGLALISNTISNPEEVIAENSHDSGYISSFRENPLTQEVFNCNNLIDISKVLS